MTTMLNELSEKASFQINTAVKRFPIPLITTFTLWVLALYIIEIVIGNKETYDYGSRVLLLNKFLLAGILIFFATTAIRLAKEVYTFANATEIALTIAGITLPIAYIFFTWPQHSTDVYDTHSLRYVITLGILILINALVVYAKNHNNEQLWSFVYKVIYKLIINGIFSGALFLGVIAMLTTSEILLEVSLNLEMLFFRSFVTICFLFSAPFFLSSIPRDFVMAVEYPKVLKIFSNYIVLPFVFIYLGISYVYILKILVTQQWPDGGVVYANLTLIVPVFVYLALAFPVRTQFNNNLLSFIMEKGILFALIPVLFVYFYAIGIRIQDYGVTIPRYIVVALGIWFLLNTLYFLLISKPKLIFMLNTALFVAIGCNYGPQNMYGISDKQQTNRLVQLLEQNSVLIEGEIQVNKVVSAEESTKIRSIYYYLKDHHGLQSFRARLSPKWQKLFDEDEYSVRAHVFGSAMSESEGKTQPVLWHSLEANETNVEGYTIYIENAFNEEYSEVPHKFDFETNEYTISTDTHTTIINLDLTEYKDILSNPEISYGSVQEKPLVIEGTQDSIKYKFLINYFYGYLEGDNLITQGLEGKLLLGFN